MKMSHIHVQVRDLKSTITWLERALGVHPDFQNERMASVRFGAGGVIFDASDVDSLVTIALASQDCQADFDRVVSHGGNQIEVLEPPTKQPWGVIAAFLKGPGAVTFEIEQVL